MLIQEKYERMDWLSYGNEQRNEGRAEGRIEGAVNMLVNLVRDGMITEEQAAEKADMTVADFVAQYLKPVMN